MTQYREHFVKSDIGDDAPAGWTKRLAAGVSPSSYPRAVQNGTPKFKRREVATSQSAGGIGLITWDALDADSNRANIQVRALYSFAASGGDTDKGLMVRGTGSAGSENFYYMDVATGSARIEIGRYNGGAFSTVLSFASFTLTPGTDYIFVFDVQGTGATVTLNAKVYAADDAEPANWNVTATDTSGSRHTAAGWAGVFNVGSGSAGAWNYVTAGTNGDAAPIPVLNSEYSQWLSDSNARVILADLKALGSIPAGSGSPPTYTTTINARASTAGFTTKPYDSPASTHYPAIISAVPTFRREMPSEFIGRVTAGFGALEISNPKPSGSTSAVAGVRDDWLRMAWKKETVTLLLGDASWSKHDFREILVGKLGQPTAPATDVIRFPLEDLSGLFDVPITTDRFITGPYAGQYEPRLFGRTQNNQIEPPRISDSAYEYFIGTEADGGMVRALRDQVDLDNGLAESDIRISAVDTGTDVITATAHGMLDGWRVQFIEDPDPPPAPLAADTDYYARDTTDDTLKVAATPGGAAINLTSADLNALVYGYGWRYDASTKVLTVVNGPDGRVTAAGVRSRDTPATTAEVYDQIVFRAHGMGLSANYKDPTSFAALEALSTTQSTVALWADTTQQTVAQLLQRLAAGTFTWYGITPDGLLQVGQIGLPESTAVMSFTTSDVKDGSLKLVDVLRPKNFETAQVSYQPWFLTGPQFDSDNPVVKQGKSFLSPYTYSGSVPPLDNLPTLRDTEENVKIDFLTSGTQSGLRDHLVSLYLLPLGIFEFQTTLRATELAIGQTIELTMPELQWREWAGSGDNPSPDNTAAFDATKAVVIGIDTNYGNGVPEPYPVRLKVFRPIPGYYPEADIAA